MVEFFFLSSHSVLDRVFFYSFCVKLYNWQSTILLKGCFSAGRKGGWVDGLKSPEVEVDLEVEDVEEFSQNKLTKSASFSSAMSKSQTKT